MRSERRAVAHAFACAFFCICFAVGTIRAQVTASVSGRVEDTTGAAVPGAAVTVISLETGAARTASTGEAGTYRVLSLPVGRYEVKAELTGFKAARQTGISLAVGEEAVVNLKLEVGAVRDEVTVNEEAPRSDMRNGLVCSGNPIDGVTATNVFWAGGCSGPVEKMARQSPFRLAMSHELPMAEL